MSLSSENKPKRDQFTLAVACPSCGEIGFSLWEETRFLTGKGPQTALLVLSDGFYERVLKQTPYHAELVCRRCETVQPE